MEKHRVKWGLWIIGIILLPIFVWVITIIPSPITIDGCLINETHWLSFFGGYIGACISILMMLYVMSNTIKQNAENLESTLKQNQDNHKELLSLQNATNDKNEQLNRENRELNEKLNREQQQIQINRTLYNQAQADVEKLRNILYENYCTIDFQRFTIAVNYININNLYYSNELLLAINRDVEMFGAKLDLYVKPYQKDASDEEKAYINVSRKIMIEYGALVNDFVFFIALYREMEKYTKLSIFQVQKYVENQLFAIRKNVAMNPEILDIYKGENNVFCKILALGKSTSNVREAIDTIFDDRIKSSASIHLLKAELLKATQNLLNYSETQSIKILTKKID